jgi:hypothetical protein
MGIDNWTRKPEVLAALTGWSFAGAVAVVLLAPAIIGFCFVAAASAAWCIWLENHPLL